MINIFCLIPAIIFGDKVTDWADNGNIPIYSVSQKDGITGRFSIGSGYINNSPYYFMMRKLENNSYKPIHISTDDINSIIESDEEPHLKEYIKVRSNKWVKNLIFADCISTSIMYDLVIPKNTVIEKFQVN